MNSRFDTGTPMMRRTLLVLLSSSIWLLTACHVRVSEQKASEYRNILENWREQMGKVNHDLELSSAPLSDPEKYLRHELGASRYEELSLSPAFLSRKRTFESQLAAWTTAFRNQSSATEMFLGGTDEWLRNLAASHMSRSTAEKRWQERVAAQARLKAEQDQLVRRFNTEVQMSLNALLSGGSSGTASVPEVAPVPVQVMAPIHAAPVIRDPDPGPAMPPAEKPDSGGQ